MKCNHFVVVLCLLAGSPQFSFATNPDKENVDPRTTPSEVPAKKKSPREQIGELLVAGKQGEVYNIAKGYAEEDEPNSAARTLWYLLSHSLITFPDALEQKDMAFITTHVRRLPTYLALNALELFLELAPENIRPGYILPDSHPIVLLFRNECFRLYEKEAYESALSAARRLVKEKKYQKAFYELWYLFTGFTRFPSKISDTDLNLIRANIKGLTQRFGDGAVDLYIDVAKKIKWSKGQPATAKTIIALCTKIWAEFFVGDEIEPTKIEKDDFEEYYKSLTI